MTRIVPIALAALVLAGVSAPAAAQPAPDRLFVFGSLGIGEVVDDEGSIGTGIDLGGGAGAWLGRSLALDLAIERMGHERQTAFLGWEGHALRVMGRARYHFRAPASRTRPFVGGGLGVMRSSGTVTERHVDTFAPGPGPRRDWDSTGLAWEGGGGVEVTVGSAFVRPEAYWTTGQLDRGSRVGVPEPPYVILRVGVAGGFRF